MTPMRIVIADDEPLARRILREELEALPGVAVVGEAEDGDSAIASIRNLRPDVVFLDLQMPGKGGFDVIDQMSGGNLPLIVIVTAYDQHAIRAFEAGAIDYLLKPVRQERLSQSVERARHLAGNPQEAAGQADRLQQIASKITGNPPRKIVGRAGEDYFLLEADEVLAFEADGDLVWIITPRRRYLATQTLKVLEERLAASHFRRIHKSALVNVKHIRKMSPLSSQRWLLTLVNDQEFVVSKRQAGAVREIIEW